MFWSDSRTVLSWLRCDQRQYRQFVAFRVGEILETTNVNEWRWIPTKQNVADEATKWQQNPGTSEESRWFVGPDFLYKDEEFWPTQPLLSNTIEEEIKVQLLHSASTSICTPDPNRFEHWNRLFHVQARIYRCVNVWKANARKENTPFNSFTKNELIAAENQLFRRAQHDCFAEEIRVLSDPTHK